MNELLSLRVAKANFVPTDAGTYVSTTLIPAGAILKSVTSVENTALAGGTNATFKVGSQSITAAIALSAFTGIDAHALTNAAGLAATASGALSITTTGTFSAGDIDVYVEYYV
jgi:hypothetical protein